MLYYEIEINWAAVNQSDTNTENSLDTVTSKV